MKVKKKSFCFVPGLSIEIYTDAGGLARHSLYTAAVGTVRPLLGSRRNGQAMLYRFQKRLSCWKYVVAVCCCVTLSISSHLLWCLL